MNTPQSEETVTEAICIACGKLKKSDEFRIRNGKRNKSCNMCLDAERQKREKKLEEIQEKKIEEKIDPVAAQQILNSVEQKVLSAPPKPTMVDLIKEEIKPAPVQSSLGESASVLNKSQPTVETAKQEVPPVQEQHTQGVSVNDIFGDKILTQEERMLLTKNYKQMGLTIGVIVDDVKVKKMTDKEFKENYKSMLESYAAMSNTTMAELVYYAGIGLLDNASYKICKFTKGAIRTDGLLDAAVGTSKLMKESFKQLDQTQGMIQAKQNPLWVIGAMTMLMLTMNSINRSALPPPQRHLYAEELEKKEQAIEEKKTLQQNGTSQK